MPTKRSRALCRSSTEPTVSWTASAWSTWPTATKKAGLSAAAGLGSLSVDGQCRPVIWVWIVLAVIVLLFLGTCICCCLCGLCSCLYKCLCCCCRDKGYTPANTHG